MQIRLVVNVIMWRFIPDTWERASAGTYLDKEIQFIATTQTIKHSHDKGHKHYSWRNVNKAWKQANFPAEPLFKVLERWRELKIVKHWEVNVDQGKAKLEDESLKII